MPYLDLGLVRGPAGADGVDGATWHSGTTTPSAGIGSNNDFYFDTVTQNVYKKISGTWTLQCNIKGADGADGSNGSDGSDGKNLEFTWDGTRLGVRVEGDASYTYVDLKGEPGEDGADGAPGANGEDGADGRGIVSITRTSGTGAPGTTDTYTITYSDNTTSTFQVYNGADGQGAGDMLLSVYDPQGKNTDIFGYVDNKVKTDVPAGAKFTDTIYTHPSTHDATIIVEDESHRFVTDIEKIIWNNKQNSLGYTPTKVTIVRW